MTGDQRLLGTVIGLAELVVFTALALWLTRRILYRAEGHRATLDTQLEEK